MLVFWLRTYKCLNQASFCRIEQIELVIWPSVTVLLSLLVAAAAAEITCIFALFYMYRRQQIQFIKCTILQFCSFYGDKPFSILLDLKFVVVIIGTTCIFFTQQTFRRPKRSDREIHSTSVKPHISAPFHMTVIFNIKIFIFMRIRNEITIQHQKPIFYNLTPKKVPHSSVAQNIPWIAATQKT